VKFFLWSQLLSYYKAMTALAPFIAFFTIRQPKPINAVILRGI
jgi:uncharacterized MnhB-related membrane protein